MLSGTPRLILQEGQQLGQAAVVLVLFVVFVMLLFVVACVLVSVWMYRDCRRRGESPGLWVSLFVIACFFPIVVLGGLIVLFVYLVSRNREVVNDARGRPLLPKAPPTPWPNPYAGPSPTNPPAPMTVGGWQSPSPVAYGAPAAPPPSPLPRVRCPRCQTVFEFQKNPGGPTRVKCPSCGEEGNI